MLGGTCGRAWVRGRGSWVLGPGLSSVVGRRRGRRSSVVGRWWWAVGRGSWVVGPGRSSVVARRRGRRSSVVGRRSWVDGR